MATKEKIAANGRLGAGSDADAVLQCMRRARQFVMCAHEKPDADVLGSGFALGLALKSLNKDVVYFLDDEVPRNLQFLPEAHLTQRDFQGVRDDAIFVFIDMSDKVRAGDALAWVPPERIINIDHHLGNKRFGRLNYVVEGEAAAGALVLDLIVGLQVTVAPPIATCLLSTLIADTGCFMYSNATPHTIRLAAALMEAGGDKELITEQLYQTRSFEGQKVLGRTLDTATLTADRICYSVVTQAMLGEFGASHEDLEDVVGALRAVERCDVAALLKETEAGDYRLSMRSRGRVNVMEIAKALGGGGHFRAAGASVSGPLDAALARVLDAIRAEMRLRPSA
ncbi:MAG: bifunctional oligoribonuclease/PAP phosphatase NrnA [Candidatus Eremiobacteraeota bacterium]|nr:bifunctional oligoribonuclease/PAP phosphatase NrnA [Candidatus Eremiobacteraeota bacterium]